MANSSGSRSSQNGASQVKNSVRRKSKKSRKRKIIKRTILIILLIVLVGAGIYVGPKLVNVMQLAKDAKSMADESTVDTFKDGKTTVIYDKNGDQLCTMKASKDMYYIDFDNIPSVLADSFVVMEDRDFYNHSGIDIKAIIRAIIANRKSDTIVQGASTITQQVAKMYFLVRKLHGKERLKKYFLRGNLKRCIQKSRYLNFTLTIYISVMDYYGVEAAAKGYFWKVGVRIVRIRAGIYSGDTEQSYKV